jgi:hypothetical protein
VAAVVLIAGLVTQAVVSGQTLIRSARVRNVIAQQQAAESAVLGFRDRYQALPGDYTNADAGLACAPAPCPRGDGDGRVQAGNGAGLREDIFAWTHLSAGGFLQNRFAAQEDAAAPDAGNTPTNIFGAYLHLASDPLYGFSGNASLRLNIKTGNLTPVEILAEVDRKSDDGLAASGAFQFSPHVNGGAALLQGGAAGACTDSDAVHARWNESGGQSDCGAATVLH